MSRIVLHDADKDGYRQFGRPPGVLTFKSRDLAEDFRYHAGKLFVEERRWRILELSEPDFSTLVLKCNLHGRYYERVGEDMYESCTLEATVASL
jgi:hypothetical protein